MITELPDEHSTEALGAALARALLRRRARPAGAQPDPFLVGLRGELGAGKTTLARALLRGLGHRGRVPSPTYTLIEPYPFEWGTVYHIDLYRVTRVEELEHLGLEDCLAADAVWLVEWPERAGAALPHPPDLDVHLTAQGAGRAAQVEAGTASGRAVLADVPAPACKSS